MKILAIETSCDETAIAILKVSEKKSPDFELLSNIVSSQIKIHQKYGGVYPALAKREHQRNLIPVLKQALKESSFLNSKFKAQNAKLQFKIQNLEKILERERYLLEKLKKFILKYEKPAVDVIAVTIGPGLEPCLWTGVNFAKTLALYWNLPIIPIDHLEAHILVNFLGPDYRLLIANSQKLFPAICLVVSGGHTQLVLMKDFGKYTSGDILPSAEYKIIGETRDDAAGECYDKTARILGLPYPGGPAIATEAEKWNRYAMSNRHRISKINLPRPMLYSKNYDFSFSGLKTAVLYDFKKRSPKVRKSSKYIQQMSAEIQQAINDVLIHKTVKAAKDFRAKTIILGGGVTANDKLRQQITAKCQSQVINYQLLIPAKKFSTDNGAMIAITAYFHLRRCSKPEVEHFKNWEKIEAEANLRLN